MSWFISQYFIGSLCEGWGLEEKAEYKLKWRERERERERAHASDSVFFTCYLNSFHNLIPFISKAVIKTLAGKGLFLCPLHCSLRGCCRAATCTR